MKKIHVINIILFFVLISKISISQTSDLKFSHLTIKDGLSHDNVYTIIQDSEGFIWAGTQSGLDKFNGYGFTSYYHDSEDTCSLISAGFGKLFHDTKGRIWIGTYRGGLSCYIPSEKKILHFSHDKNDKNSLLSNLIRAITEDSYGNIWIANAKGGLCKYNEKQNNFTRYTNEPGNPNSLIDNNLQTLAADNEGNVWIGTGEGLDKLNVKTGEFERYSNTKNENTISSSRIQSIYIDKKGMIWVGTYKAGLNMINPKTDEVIYYKSDKDNPDALPDNRIQIIFEDSQNTLWIGTYRNGISILDRETGIFTTYRNHPENENSLSFNKIESIIEDNAHNLWIGTRGGGINILDLKPQKFHNVNYSSKHINRLPSSNITSVMAENNNTIWLGTAAGICRYNISENKFTVFKNEPKNKNSLSNNRVRSIFIKNDVIWIGTYRGGLEKLEFINGKAKFTHFPSLQDDENSVISQQVNSVFVDKSNAVWVGTNVGLDKIVFENGKTQYTHFKHSKIKQNSLSDNYITSILEDNKGNIWVGTSKGLNKYNFTTNDFSQILNKSSNKNDLDINAITSIFQDSKGRIWVGTDGSGLYELVSGNKLIKHSDATFKTGNIAGIVEAESGNLWISTGKGLSMYNTQDKKYTNYDITDGLSESGFNRNSCTITPNGNMYFGHISGFTWLNPKEIKLNSHKPKIVTTEIKIFNEPYFKNLNSFCSATPSSIKELNLSYLDYVFSFEFSSLDYTNPSKNRYLYKMEGFNKEWIDLGHKHYAMFTSLPPGRYTLRVKGTNNDGIWSDDETSLAIKIYIKPPFWKTPLFFVIIGILAILLILTIIRLRTRKLKREKEILEDKVAERTREVEKQNKELEKLSIVASETDNAVTIMSANGDIEWVNEGFTKMYALKLNEFIELKGKNILTGKFNKDIKTAVKQCLKEKRTIVSKSIVKREKKDDDIWLQTTWTPIINDNNKITKLIAIDSDITDLKKAEIEITEQKDELEAKNEVINRINENIHSSIRYAKTIQQSILPFKSRFEEFAESFIIYKPKDIVSGDFYWFTEIEGARLIAVVDCTGHGVPGAFMSMIASRLLNEIVIEKKIYDPKEILTTLDRYVKTALKQKETDNRDGLDMCLVRLNDNNEIVFAGAKRDLYYYSEKDNELKVLKASRKSIGGVYVRYNKVCFENKITKLNKKDIMYLSSDGYIDQNDISRHRFGTPKFLALLNEIVRLPMKEQEVVLNDILVKFQENEPQRDDITIIGLKIK